MKKKSLIIAIVIAIAVGGVSFGVYNYNRSGVDGGIPRNAIPVQLEMTRTQTITQQIIAKGTVELVDRHTVYPKGQGRVSEVLVKKGDSVASGQVIARYDKESLAELHDRLAEAKLTLRSADLALQSSLLPVVSQIEIAQADASIAQARNSLSNIESQISQYELTLAQIDVSISHAEKTYENTRLLYEGGVLSRQELDSTFAGLKQLRDQRAVTDAQRLAAIDAMKRAEEAVARAEDQFDLTLAKQSDPQVTNKVEQQRLQIEQARLRIDQIQNQIDKHKEEEICEFDGIVLELGVQQGQMLTAPTPLLVIADVSSANLVVKVNVPEAEAADLRFGQAVLLRGAAFDEVYSATIGEISPIAEQQIAGNSVMRVLPIEILLSEADTQLKAGYSVEAVITTRIVESAVVVPLMATLSSEDGEDYVFIMGDDFSIERKVITLGGYSGMYIEAKTGLSPNEKVVVNPPPALKDGTIVRPVGTVLDHS